MALATVRRADLLVRRSRPAGARRRLAGVEPGEVVLLTGRSGCGQDDADAGARRASCRTFTAAVSEAAVESAAATRGEPDRPSSPAPSPRSSRIPRTRSSSAVSLAEVSFGIENLGRASSRDLAPRVEPLSTPWAPATWPSGMSPSSRAASCSASASRRRSRSSQRLLLLDEPTSQLDPDGARALLDLVRRLARERGRPS